MMTEFMEKLSTVLRMPAVILTLGAIAVLIIVFLFCIAPRGGAKKKKDCKIFFGRVYAHRGIYDNEDVPENSLAAFRAALSRKVGIELDIHRTADGEVVVFHDDTLFRMCRENSRVEDLTMRQLRDCRLLGTNEGIPTLREVLELVEGRVPLIIELKGENGDTSLCDAAFPILENYRGPYCVESFNPLLVRRYGQLAPHVMRGILSTRFRRDGEKRGMLGFLLTWMLLNFLARPDFAAVRHPYGKFLPVKLFRRMGGAVLAWTVRERAEYLKAAPHFDAFICENIDSLLKK